MYIPIYINQRLEEAFINIGADAEGCGPVIAAWRFADGYDILDPNEWPKEDRQVKHEPELVEEPGMIDLVKCSCGWESPPYYDGREYALADHREHVKNAEAAE